MWKLCFFTLRYNSLLQTNYFLLILLLKVRQLRMLSIPDIFVKKLLLSLEFCEKCCRERQQEEYSSQFTYINKAIYVRKVTEESRSAFADTLNSSKSPTVTAPASDGEGVADEGDDIYSTTVCLIIYILLVVLFTFF